jgi:hypothetical protein
MVNKPTPALSPPSTLSSTLWSPKTSYNARTLEKQADSVKKLLHITNLNENSPSSHAFNQLIKGSLLTMHNAAVLARENYDLRDMVDQL